MHKRNWISLLGSCLAVVSIAVCGAAAESAGGATIVTGEAELALTPDESQCGPTWDLQDVEQYDGTLGVSRAWVQRHEGAVAYHVRLGCSGTMISEDLFLSAGHCLYEVGDVIRFNYQDDQSGNPRATQDFTVSAIVEQENNGNWDYAIVRLTGNPGRIFDYARLADRDEDAGNNVVIIGHPAGVPKALAAGPVLDYASDLGTHWFRHQVDTTGGSSGAGVLSEDGYLVGVHTNAGCDPGNSAMRMTQLIDHSATLQGVLAWQRGAPAYVWANDPTAANYTPDPTYAYNPAAGTISITRTGIGQYTVTFQDYGGHGQAGGNVQVTAYGGTNEYCKVESWSSGGPDFLVNVRCFTAASAPVDTSFVAQAVWPTTATSLGFAWAANPSAPIDMPGPPYSYNSAGGPITITRTDPGRYDVRFTNLGNSGRLTLGGNVQVTAYGSGRAHCRLDAVGTYGSDARATVRCMTAAGGFVDTPYSIRVERLGFGMYQGYAVVSGDKRVDPLYSVNSEGGPITVTRNGGLTYVSFAKLGGNGTPGGNVQVTALESGTNIRCKVDYWDSAGPDFIAAIRCVNGPGSTVRAGFSVQVVAPSLP